MLLLENHWGLTTFAPGVLRILETVDSPWLKAILDMGNFIFEDDMYEAVERVAPYVWLAHAKTYFGGGSWYSLELDYARIFRICGGRFFAATALLKWKGRRRGDSDAEEHRSAARGVVGGLRKRRTRTRGARNSL